MLNMSERKGKGGKHTSSNICCGSRVRLERLEGLHSLNLSLAMVEILLDSIYQNIRRVRSSIIRQWKRRDEERQKRQADDMETHF